MLVVNASTRMIRVGIQAMVATPSENLDWSDGAARLLCAFLLIAINAFFVTAEFSVVFVRRSRIAHLVNAGDMPAKTVQNLQRSIERLLSTTQIGITLSSLALGWLGEAAMVGLVESWLGQLPLPLKLQAPIAHSVALPLTFIGLAYLQIVLGAPHQGRSALSMNGRNIPGHAPNL
jgi:CBS domain containing-hemolysin-like protein